MDLKDLQEAAEKEYGDFVLNTEDGVVCLRNPLAMDPSDIAKLEHMGDEEAESVDALAYPRRLLEIVCKPEHQERLAKVLDQDRRFAAVLAGRWREHVQAEKA